MTHNRNPSGTPQGLLARCARAFRAQDGAISPLMTLLLVPIIGVLGLATETSSWYFTQRSMQNAADTAALASATNGCTPAKSPCGVTYDQEAAAAAKQYGFVSGVNNTTVTPALVTCPADATATCFKVTITKKLPIYMVRVVGFNGSDALGSGRAQNITASAIASPKKNNTNAYCLLALAANTKTVEGILCNGCSKADMHGCKVGTNGFAQCNGGNLNADVVDAAGATATCDKSQSGNTGITPLIADPYAALAANIPANKCFSGYNHPETFNSNQSWGSEKQVCGDLTISGNVDLTTPAGGTVLVIRNGSLTIANGKTLKTLANSGLTIIFTGPDPTNTYSHVLAGKGTLDISPSSSDPWKGVAVYQDPALPNGSGVNMANAGNSPTWNVTGLIYLPNSDVQFSGIVNKASFGVDCFALVTRTFQANGTAKIVELQTQCNDWTLPTGGSGPVVRQALVQ
ncbi:pilus assembly protein TadG-related protein [Phenylobacterium sp.]|jgi:hypothetical protein|uniref:pilus assembly protein TadG-related protein n=1 Tax=Phenylobacterium sp. TaxID=1871053 RepID=UPI002F40CDCA